MDWDKGRGGSAGRGGVGCPVSGRGQSSASAQGAGLVHRADQIGEGGTTAGRAGDVALEVSTIT